MNTEEPQVIPELEENWGSELRDWAVSLSIAIVVALLIQNYAFAQTEVRNISMQHTLVEGQRLIEDKISYHFEKPERGDIVIIDGPESDLRLIKRVIGLPGDITRYEERHRVSEQCAAHGNLHKREDFHERLEGSLHSTR